MGFLVSTFCWPCFLPAEPPAAETSFFMSIDEIKGPATSVKLSWSWVYVRPSAEDMWPS